MDDDWNCPDDMFPRLTTKLRSYVVARDPPHGRILLGGLGALGVGQMWMDEEPYHADKPGYAEAPIEEEGDGLSMWFGNAARELKALGDVSMITDEQAAQWRALADAATAGPWEVQEYEDEEWQERQFRIFVWDEKKQHPLGLGNMYGGNAVWLPEGEGDGGNAHFVAAAREAVPALLGERDALREEVRQLLDLRAPVNVQNFDEMGAAERALPQWIKLANDREAENERLRAELERLQLLIGGDVPGSCDWGDCDAPAYGFRHDEKSGWLPVCENHTGAMERARAVVEAAIEAHRIGKDLNRHRLPLWDESEHPEPHGQPSRRGSCFVPLRAGMWLARVHRPRGLRRRGVRGRCRMTAEVTPWRVIVELVGLCVTLGFLIGFWVGWLA